MKKIFTTMGIVIALLFVAMNLTAQVAKPTKKNTVLPGVWQRVSAQERLKALRVAQLDAYAQLADRVYGFQLNGGSTVYDFVLASDNIKTKMQNLLKGATETEKPEYTEDGIIQVVYGVNLRKVIEVIKNDKETLPGGRIKTSYEKSIKHEDKLIEALGNAALPGSKGLKMIRAKRAAELDAYRKMAERFVGVKISRDTTVKDLCLESDKMVSAVAAYLKGLKPVAIEYESDNSCEVTIQLKIREVIETVETLVKYYRKNSKVTKESIKEVNREINDKTFTVTGMGAPRLDTVSIPTSVTVAVDADGAYKMEKTIIKKVISQKIVTE